jgi:hypothetical protein
MTARSEMARSLAHVWLALTLCVLASPILADPPVIEAASAQKTSSGWRIDVTLSHPDTGWDHYTDGWRVLTPDGEELGLRSLLHPHEAEQPFTRSLNGVQIPDGLRTVRIQARCNVDGWAEPTMVIDLK